MATRGIITLADDAVVDGLIALLNSLEDMLTPDLSVCVIPYSDEIEQVQRAIQNREHVQLYDDAGSIAAWESFAREVWEAHPEAMQLWEQRYGHRKLHRGALHRKFCCFDGPFEEFLFLDADIVILASVEPYLEKLGESDLVVYDDQFRGPTHVFRMDSPRLREIFTEAELTTKMFCTGLFASRRTVLDGAKRAKLLADLCAGDAEVLYPWAPDQTVLNYMVLRSGCSVYNFHLELDERQRSATCVTYPDFEALDGGLSDRGIKVPFLHYIGIPPAIFSRLNDGDNVTFPYRDLYLEYRYLHEPRPLLRGRPKPYFRPPGLAKRLWQRVRARIPQFR